MAADSGFFLIICSATCHRSPRKAKSQGHDFVILATLIPPSALLARLEELINRPDETGLAIWRFDSDMGEPALRLLIGGTVVILFGVLAETLRPKSFAGLFGAVSLLLFPVAP